MFSITFLAAVLAALGAFFVAAKDKATVDRQKNADAMAQLRLADEMKSEIMSMQSQLDRSQAAVTGMRSVLESPAKGGKALGMNAEEKVRSS
jgi:hypothetical protein